MKCLPLAGSLRHRVTLQSLTRTADGQGGFTEEWTDEATLWASVEPLKGYERFQAMQLQTPLTHAVTLRYRPGVTTAHRLLFGDRIFDVREVINEGERNATLRLTCVETGIFELAPPTEEGDFFLFEDGVRFLYEDGSYFLFEGDGQALAPTQFLFQDGAEYLFEDGTGFLFQDDAGWIAARGPLALFQDGSTQLFESGETIQY